MRRTLSAALVPLLVALGLTLATPLAPARAEDVVTKVDGARLRGEVLQDTPEFVKIKTAGGVITIPREEVATVERAKDLRKELHDRRAELERAGAPSGWCELARWCQDRELWADAIDCFWRVLKLDPDHKDARFELGFRRLDAKWVTEGESLQVQGLRPGPGPVGLARGQGKARRRARQGRRRLADQGSSGRARRQGRGRGRAGAARRPGQRRRLARRRLSRARRSRAGQARRSRAPARPRQPARPWPATGSRRGCRHSRGAQGQPRAREGRGQVEARRHEQTLRLLLERLGG